LIDLSEDSQYPPISRNIIKGKEFFSYQNWKKRQKAQPKGSENPILGMVGLGDRQGRGVKCGHVFEGLSLYKAGLRKDDIITQFGEKRVKAFTDISKQLSHLLPNQHIDVTYLRGWAFRTHYGLLLVSPSFTLPLPFGS
jgi:S1-C subfamily serine protease